MGTVGRPTSLTPEVAKAICDTIEAGNYRSVACAAAGISRATLVNWERLGAEGKAPYADFLAELQSAEARFEIKIVGELRNAVKGIPGESSADLWQSKAWLLERRFASRWCARVKQQTAENVDALAQKLKAKPDLQAAVIAELAGDDESPAAGANGAH